MEFVFFRFRRTDKMDTVMKGLMGLCLPQNFWARTAPGCTQQKLYATITVLSGKRYEDKK